jgi:outer membrane protein assembly factor BamD (BamD/ComL family)
MSISALSSSLISDLSQQWQNPFRQIKQDYNELASALQSGNLSDAQSAYASIQQLVSAHQNSSNSNTSSSASNTIQTDFAALGQALQSGSLSQAQSAFSQLQSDLQTALQSGAVSVGAPPPWFQQQQTQDQYVSSASQGQNPIEEALEDYTQLASDLQSGNLSGAQSAFLSLQQLLPAEQASSNSSASSGPSGTIQTDFAALSQALTSGNLTQAQSAFSQLQSDLQTASQPTGGAIATLPDPAQTPAQQVRQDYAQLAGDLQSGNLTGAQSAFTALEEALQTQTGTNATSETSSSTAPTGSSDPIANDLNALGQALSSGNLTQAQSAFSQLQSDIQSARQSAESQSQSLAQPLRTDIEGHHHRHHGGGGYSSQSSTASTASTGSGSSVSVYA